eukprot:symbB.v1.2.013710.t1/scaffold922.1/size178049/2
MEIAMDGLEETWEELLQLAYGEEFGKTGHHLAGHEAVGADDVASVLEGGSSLLYGELLPEGVARLAEAFFEEQDLEGSILELGMGTGKVALQLFLQRSHHVFGIELAPSRWRLAMEALASLAAARPKRFRYEVLSSTSSRLTDLQSQRHCDFACGSLLDTPEDILKGAAAVVLEVCLPVEVQREAGQMLQAVPTGCRVVSYSALHQLTPNCKLRPVNGHAGGLSLPSSWKPSGHLFAFYVQGATETTDTSFPADGNDTLEALRGVNGCPSRARRLRYTDDVLGAPAASDYPWQKGDKVLVGYSWLPFPDLGDPDDETSGTLDGVTWMDAFVVKIHPDHFVNVCYEDDGTIEENVHPDRLRLRKMGHKRCQCLPWNCSLKKANGEFSLELLRRNPGARPGSKASDVTTKVVRLFGQLDVGADVGQVSVAYDLYARIRQAGANNAV